MYVSSVILCRYDEAARVVEFLFDNSTDTYWESAAGETPVTVQLRLDSLTNISKIFISFVSPLPTVAMLEYAVDSQWMALQYWADNCTSTGTTERSVQDKKFCKSICIMLISAL